MAANRQVRLTTVDNPYDIFTDFDQWYRFDQEKDYRCCELIAMFSYCSDALSDAENEHEMERAIDEFIKHDVTLMYKKVVSTDSNKTNTNDDNETIVDSNEIETN